MLPNSHNHLIQRNYYRFVIIFSQYKSYDFIYYDRQIIIPKKTDNFRTRDYMQIKSAPIEFFFYFIKILIYWNVTFPF